METTSNQPRAEQTRQRTRAEIPEDFAAFIRSPAFPCVGAKSALARGGMRAFEAGDINCPADDGALRRALMAFADLPARASFVSFACLFSPSARPMSEEQFEAALWRRLQALRDLDSAAGVRWAEEVSSDPANPQFSMSIGGTGYFIVGLHPEASRPARRFSRPVMIFNLHEQFMRLRADGTYDLLQQAVRKRDMRLAGSINPMLTAFGERSEAPQYSGRRVGGDWRCPFRPKTQ